MENSRNVVRQMHLEIELIMRSVALIKLTKNTFYTSYVFGPNAVLLFCKRKKKFSVKMQKAKKHHFCSKRDGGYFGKEKCLQIFYFRLKFLILYGCEKVIKIERLQPP